jgi:hypothetical protein
MLVKPMKAGVTATVLMDCCHSGTVLDLPYKFGSDDRHMTREDGFNMDVVMKAVRKVPLSETEWRNEKQIRKKAAKEKEKVDKKRAQRIEETKMCGPKLAPNGQPVLPSRPAVAKAKHAQKDEQAPKKSPRSSRCVIM